MPIPETPTFVDLVIGDQTIVAQVLLASETSMMLGFDDAARVGGGLAIGMLPVARDAAGVWTEILFGTVVSITPRASAAPLSEESSV